MLRKGFFSLGSPIKPDLSAATSSLSGGMDAKTAKSAFRFANTLSTDPKISRMVNANIERHLSRIESIHHLSSLKLRLIVQLTISFYQKPSHLLAANAKPTKCSFAFSIGASVCKNFTRQKMFAEMDWEHLFLLPRMAIAKL